MPGVKIGGVNINNLRYADKTVLIDERETDLQNILNKVVSESEILELSKKRKSWKTMIANVLEGQGT